MERFNLVPMVLSETWMRTRRDYAAPVPFVADHRVDGLESAWGGWRT